MQNFNSPNFNARREAPRNRSQIIDEKVAQVAAKRLREEDFIDRPYSKGDVDADLAYVMERRKEQKREETPQSIELKKLADTFEALILWNAEQAEWLGSKATTIKTSEYDDRKNGVDMVVEFKEERSPSYLGLAADVTFSSDKTIIAKKFAILREQIKRGTLAQVKYFHSEHTGFDGQLSKLPEVVIGVSEGMVKELSNLWADGNHKALAIHKVGIMILRQIEVQLKTFARYATSMNQLEAARIYSDRFLLIQGILAEKVELVAKVEAASNTDPTHSEIMKFVENWSRY